MIELVFQAGLKHLKATNPDHPLLSRILSNGYCTVSIAYLKNALNTVVVPTAPEPEPENKIKSSPELNKMYNELDSLFKKRAARSNSFHDCIDDENRALISDQVEEIQLQITRKMNMIDFYKKNGRKPIDKETDEFPIPKDDIALWKKHLHLKQSISRAEKSLSERKKQGLSTDRAEKSLKHLKEYEIIIERTISSKGIQS